MKKLIINPENPQGILVDLTLEEIAQKQVDEQKSEQEKQERLAKEEAHKQAKDSALAKLSALGLTEEEVKAIL